MLEGHHLKVEKHIFPLFYTWGEICEVYEPSVVPTLTLIVKVQVLTL